MLKFIDNFLNRTTMYRLLFYYLIGLLGVAVIFGFFKIIPYDPVSILFSVSFIVLICFVINTIFAKVNDAPVNAESFYITAFILALLISPPQSLLDPQYLSIAVLASLIAIASKFVLAIKKKHIFNPVALAVVATAFTINESASWWVGIFWMAPFVLIGGLLIVRKIRRLDLVLSFLVVALTAVVINRFSDVPGVFSTVYKTLISTPILFFATVMLTEPLTTPPTRLLRIIYGSLVGFLFLPSIHFGSIYLSPELALVIGNIFSYLVSPKQKLILTLKERIKVADGTYDFVFFKNESFNFQPGQYLEWTIPAQDVDNRGNRRYFTIASSPTEREVRMGVKFYPEPSTFKKQLFYIPVGDQIVASQLAGDFTMPRNPKSKLVFIAGGIGVTPFRSMVKYLIDTKQKRDIVLLYSNKTPDDIAYKNIFDLAGQTCGVRTLYNLTDMPSIPADWQGPKGFITGEMIKVEIPDYLDRKFYISGPHSMVDAFEKTLTDIGVKSSQIKIDFFPGFA